MLVDPQTRCYAAPGTEPSVGRTYQPLIIYSTDGAIVYCAVISSFSPSVLLSIPRKKLLIVHAMNMMIHMRREGAKMDHTDRKLLRIFHTVAYFSAMLKVR